MNKNRLDDDYDSKGLEDTHVNQARAEALEPKRVQAPPSGGRRLSRAFRSAQQ